jgi:hypothetical protein
MRMRDVTSSMMAIALLGGACLLAPMPASAASGDQLSLTAIGQFFFPANVPVTTRAGLRRVDLRAIVSSDRVAIDVTNITPITDFKVDSEFVCTGGRSASVAYSGGSPLTSLDDRTLLCGIGRRGESIFGAIGIFEP